MARDGARVSPRKKPGRGGVREGAGRTAGTGEHDDWLRLRAPSDLLARIDAAADAAAMSRAEWVRQALERALTTRR
jgi:hypothetical protein